MAIEPEETLSHRERERQRERERERETFMVSDVQCIMVPIVCMATSSSPGDPAEMLRASLPAKDCRDENLTQISNADLCKLTMRLILQSEA